MSRSGKSYVILCLHLWKCIRFLFMNFFFCDYSNEWQTAHTKNLDKKSLVLKRREKSNREKNVHLKHEMASLHDDDDAATASSVVVVVIVILTAAV